MSPSDCVIALVENKIDLQGTSTTNETVKDQGLAIAKENAITLFHKVSAKNGTGVEEMLHDLVLTIHTKQIEHPREKRRSSVLRRQDFMSARLR